MTLKRSRWLIFIGLATSIIFLFASAALQGGQGTVLMPLDDVYIHFQYARQMALGEPSVYNPGGVPTSGATSFVYPYLLAFGYLVGFQGLNLGWWALLVGSAALVASLAALYRLCENFACPVWVTWLTVLAFGLNGSITWHFMSGMETGLMIAFTLWTLTFFVEQRLRGFVLAATLLALTRPEGSIMAAGAVILMVARIWRPLAAHEKYPARRRRLLWFALPVSAFFVQPAINYLITGSSVATGNQAKSLLAMVPHDWGVIVSRILENFVRMWWEFFTGYAPNEGWYLLPGVGLLAILCALALLFRREWQLVGLLLLGWMLALTGAVSTLDTAFWHFKRYQMPLMALFFPLAAWAVAWLLSQRKQTPRLAIASASILVLGFNAALIAQFWHYHRSNVSYVYHQPYQMALWLRENTSEEALIAVHDVGLMRYAGERDTLDMVGLTTPGAAAYWRNGPGAVAEFLIQNQPDYIASYGVGHGYGLRMLADTALYGNVQAEFLIEDWQSYLNVALAADFQGIYQPDWDQILEPAFFLQQERIMQSLNANVEMTLVDRLDIGSVASEQTHDYESTSVGGNSFPTQARGLDYLTDICVGRTLTGTCTTVDAVRAVSAEAFMLQGVDPLLDAILITRVHSQTAGAFDVRLDGEWVAQRQLPAIPGKWLDIATLIPQEYISQDTLEVELTALDSMAGYEVAAHWLLQVDDVSERSDGLTANPIALYQDGAFTLTYEPYQVSDEGNLVFSLVTETSGAAGGDYRFFAHLYDDINQPPLEQWDGYFGDAPPGNWLPGILSESVEIPVADIEVGRYQLAIGFYNPNDPTDRLIPESDLYEVTPDGRLWLGEVVID